MVKSTKSRGPSGRASQGRRGLSVKLRTAKGRKIASTRWLQRQLNDPYVAEARRQGYRSRAAFKLIEIDDKRHLLKPGKTVIDLGAAPGGWSQVAAERVKSEKGKGIVIAADLNEIEPIPGVEFMALDLNDPHAAEQIKAALGGAKVDVVLSDMAAPAMGHKPTDHIRVVMLAEAALDLAEDVLVPGGAFLAKVLQGGADRDLLQRLRLGFAKVSHVKPKASRSESSEVYVLGMGFRGAPK
ncbi:MAG: RlmE family RNA methyltransferase [Methyloceanibacter sp.]|jgi:23S rRNA (uridine2552-2'-O)-methyltransferase